MASISYNAGRKRLLDGPGWENENLVLLLLLAGHGYDPDPDVELFEDLGLGPEQIAGSVGLEGLEARTSSTSAATELVSDAAVFEELGDAEDPLEISGAVLLFFETNAFDSVPLAYFEAVSGEANGTDFVVACPATGWLRVRDAD